MIVELSPEPFMLSYIWQQHCWIVAFSWWLIVECRMTPLNHDVICLATFAIRALKNAVSLYKINVLLTCKLASLIRIQYLRFCHLECLF